MKYWTRINTSFTQNLFLSAFTLLFLLACGGGGDPTRPNHAKGTLFATVSGLPDGMKANLSLVAADGSSHNIAAGDTAKQISVGEATLYARQSSRNGTGTWVPAKDSFKVSLNQHEVSSINVHYSAAPIVLNIQNTGLPQGTTSFARITGPNNTEQTVTSGSPFLTSLAGIWTVQGEALSATNFRWLPTESPHELSLLPGDSAHVTLHYSVVSGAINIQATGLEIDAKPVFTISQGNLSFTREGPGIIADVPVGRWTVTANRTSTYSALYTPNVALRSVNVELGTVSSTSIPYSSTPISANLSVEAAYITQAIQEYNGLTPLVAGREALLRAFLKSSVPNDWKPKARAHFYRNNVLIDSLDLHSESDGVTTSVNEGELRSSWNAHIPARLIVPGLRITVTADPDNTIQDDIDLSDNIWPRSGNPATVNVFPLDKWRVVLVPVSYSTPNGSLTGNVNIVNAPLYTAQAANILPVGEMEVTVRQPYTSNIQPLQSNDGNKQWTLLLAEVNALRVIEGSSGQYWYGVVQVPYSSGIAGYGYIPGRAAVGWDVQPGAGMVAAHEWGHNLSLAHAPCGNVSTWDQSFPNVGGTTGNWGWDHAAGKLMSPFMTDLMGYCSNQWISSYNWTRALSYRYGSPGAIVANSSTTASLSNSADKRLLVWGSISEGNISIEPAFVVPGSNPAVDPPINTSSAVLIELLDANGNIIRSTVSDAPLVDHSQTNTRGFAAAIPISEDEQNRTAELRVRDLNNPLSSSTKKSSSSSASANAFAYNRETAVSAKRLPNGRIKVEWNNTVWPAILIKSADNNQVLAILRNSGSELPWLSGDLDIELSNGTGSQTVRITPQ